ncbi:hypothetical protein OZ662_03750 [Elizabethkingia sp. HX WYD]|nr:MULTISPECIES: hypothetical protein [Elizabethkingia]MDX8574516.1 hypothetical protein [Elizabethkingia sp. HX WYD]
MGFGYGNDEFVCFVVDVNNLPYLETAFFQPFACQRQDWKYYIIAVYTAKGLAA